MRKTCQTIALIYLCFVTSTVANAIELQFPVSCQIMGNCWITNHVDLRGTTGLIEDYMCGQKASNGNKSTHISLGSMSEMEKNIAVVAVADGVVNIAKDQGGHCGHRILIEHEKGWKTNYCHLKPETLVVKQGQEVKRGQIMGAVGMSGRANWPRLSFALMRNGMIFDPFSGRTNIEGCPAQSKPMWVGGLNPPYEPAHVTSVGFTVGYPSTAAIMTGGAGSATEISSKTKQIALWAMIMNVMDGDDINLTIHAPDGRIVSENITTATRNRDYYPIYLSKNRKSLLWDIGQYHGEVTVTRHVNGNQIEVGRRTQFEMIKTE